MKELMTRFQGGINETLNSLEVTFQINIFRSQEENKAELRHDTMLNIIRDEFEEEISLQEILESNYESRGKKYPMFELTLNQSKQILMRESKFVRKAMIKYIENLEEALNKPMTIEDMMVTQLQSMKDLKHDVVSLENKFDSVVTLESGKQRKLQKAIACRVMNRYDYIDSNTNPLNLFEKDKKIKSKLFSAIHRELKNKFGVSSYKDIKVAEYETALHWIQNWIENSDIREYL